MKKTVIAVAAVGLIALAACNRSPEGAAIENNAAMQADAMESQADNMEAMADNTANAQSSEMMENQADSMEAAADNTRAAGDAMADNADARATNNGRTAR